jgi:hypothetical protein
MVLKKVPNILNPRIYEKNQFVKSFFLMTLFFFFSFSCSILSGESDPEVDNAKLDEAFQQAKKISGIKSLLVSKNGVIIREEYFNNGGKDIQQDVRSVTKSVVAILTGIAIEK